MRLTDEAGRSEEAYGFDEFGNDIRTAKDIFQDSMQSFGFTGYQMDSAGGLYFAQARRYDAGAGRFVSEDFLKSSIHDESLQLLLEQTDGPGGFEWKIPIMERFEEILE